jgi:hypothetical protein
MRKLMVRRFAKSLGIVLPRNIVSRLQRSEGDYLLQIEAFDSGYQLTQRDPALEKKTKKSKEILGRYRNALRALASAK